MKKIKLKTAYEEKYQKDYGKSHHLEVWDWFENIGIRHISTLELHGILLDIKEVKKLKKFIDKFLKKNQNKK